VAVRFWVCAARRPLSAAPEVRGRCPSPPPCRFEAGQPRGLLHRAFSVFLFDSRNRLLLQQRAASKITFPRVWTNTCCSHPLYGYSPTEVDTRADVESGETPGAKRAAVRKLLHELGIPPAQLPLEQFKFLTRLHYCAADTGGRRQPRAWAASGATQGLAWGCGFREGLRPSCGRRLPSLRGGSRMPLTCTARDTFCPGLPWQAHGARRRSGGSTRWTTSCL
jgi:isopentenyl-diphosphate delta-isomerase type 1